MSERRTRTLKLMQSFFLFSIALTFVLLLIAIGWMQKSGTDTIDKTVTKENKPDLPILITEVEDDNYFRSTLSMYMDNPSVDTESLADILYRYSEYNHSNGDSIQRINNSFYISKFYLSYSEKIDDALILACQEMEYNSELLEKIDSNKTEYEIENLSILSTIYKLLGIKYIKERATYYERAADCLESLLYEYKLDDENKYRTKLMDFVDVLEELGEKKRVIDILEAWEAEHEDYGFEFYFEHVCLLLSEAGNEEELVKLKSSLKNMKEAKEDFRYETIMGEIDDYIEHNSCN